MPRSYLFVMWAGGGSVNPFLGLAEILRAAGHRVAAVAPHSLKQRLGGAGIDVVASYEGWLAGANDVVEAVERFAPDVLVVDYMLTSALCGAERCGLPTVAIVHTLYRQLLLDGSPNPIGMAGSVEVVNEVRAEIGLEPISRHAELLHACELVLVTAPQELDEPGDVPSNVVYVGAVFEGPGPDREWKPPAGEGPLVVVTTGTVGDAESEIELLNRVVAALGDLRVRGLVTVPDYIEASRVDSLPNVTVSGYVRHSAVLPHADLLVTHTGLGSVVAALAFGVPMVCLPLAREQPDNARAVVRLGAGRRLDPAADAPRIREAIESELRRPTGVLIAADPTRALDLLERVAAPPVQEPDL